MKLIVRPMELDALRSRSDVTWVSVVGSRSGVGESRSGLHLISIELRLGWLEPRWVFHWVWPRADIA